MQTPGGTAPWDCQWPSFVTTSDLFAGYGDKYYDNIDDNPANAAIRWLMTKSRRECNTFATFHTNFNGVQPHSKHWNTYVQKDLLCKDTDGNLRHDDYIRGYVMLQKAFETGEWQKRIAELIETFPEILTTKLLHNDWNWNTFSEKHNYTQGDSMADLRKCMEYLKETYKIDTSCELVSNESLKPECDYGMQCRALSFERKDSKANPSRMKVPAYILVGGNGGYNDQFDIPETQDVTITSDGMTINSKRLHFSNETLLFGATTQGNEGRYYTASIEDAPEYQKYVTPNALFRDFCYATIPWYYLNRLLRLDANKSNDRYTEIKYSENVRSFIENGEVCITKDGYSLRQGNDIFMPELWKENREIMAWSDDGYENKAWILPTEWGNIASVDLYDNTVLGLKLRQSDLKVIDGKINLSLEKFDGVIIVPNGENPNDSGKLPVSGTAEFISLTKHPPSADGTLFTKEGKDTHLTQVKFISGEAGLHEIIDVDIGENAQNISLYFLAHDGAKCQAVLEVIDANSIERIGHDTTKLLSDFKGGIYVTYKITGRVRFRITRFHFDRFGRCDGQNEANLPRFAGVFFDK